MGRPFPSELRARLRPIVLLLSSGNSGEVLAAAGKIDLLLRKHDSDWHDFADHVVADRAVAPLPQGQARSPASAWGADTGGRQIDAAQLIGIIEAIRKSARLAVGQLARIPQRPRVPSRRLSEREPEREAASIAARPRRPSRSREGLAHAPRGRDTFRTSAAGTPLGLPGVRRRPKAPRTRPRFVTRPDPPGAPAPQIRVPGEATLRPSACRAATVPAS